MNILRFVKKETETKKKQQEAIKYFVLKNFNIKIDQKLTTNDIKFDYNLLAEALRKFLEENNESVFVKKIKSSEIYTFFCTALKLIFKLNNENYVNGLLKSLLRIVFKNQVLENCLKLNLFTKAYHFSDGNQNSQARVITKLMKFYLNNDLQHFSKFQAYKILIEQSKTLKLALSSSKKSLLNLKWLSAYYYAALVSEKYYETFNMNNSEFRDKNYDIKLFGAQNMRINFLEIFMGFERLSYQLSGKTCEKASEVFKYAISLEIKRSGKLENPLKEVLINFATSHIDEETEKRKSQISILCDLFDGKIEKVDSFSADFNLLGILFISQLNFEFFKQKLYFQFTKKLIEKEIQSGNKQLKFDTLIEKIIFINNDRQLENFIIELISSGFKSIKINQNERVLDIIEKNELINNNLENDNNSVKVIENFKNQLKSINNSLKESKNCIFCEN